MIKSIKVRWVGYVAHMGQRRSGKRNGKRTLGRPRLRLEDNIKMNFQEVVWDMDNIDLTHDRGKGVFF